MGANAVNGVINVISKSAKDTQGLLASAGGGTEERAFGSLRYGGKLGENVWYRAYAMYFYRDNFVFANGAEGADEWQVGQGGFRVDWEPTAENLLTFQGDAYQGDEGQSVSVPSASEPDYSAEFVDDIDIQGGNVIGRWTHYFPDGTDLALQVYYDRRKHQRALTDDREQTFDVDFQHRFLLGQRQEFVWGLGYRLGYTKLKESAYTVFVPEERTTHLYSAFLQDEIALVPERLSLILGSKFEHNDFSGFEIQPNVRMTWTPSDRQTVWGAVARAVRTPNRLEHDGELLALYVPPPFLGDPTLPTAVIRAPSSGFESEELVAYEIGYRVQPHRRLTLDVAAFYNVYDRLKTTDVQGLSVTATNEVLGLLLGNNLAGETYGVEITSRWQPTDWWRLEMTYSYGNLR